MLRQLVQYVTLLTKCVSFLAADICRVTTVTPITLEGTVSGQACSGSTCPVVAAGQACQPEVSSAGNVVVVAGKQPTTYLKDGHH